MTITPTQWNADPLHATQDLELGKNRWHKSAPEAVRHAFRVGKTAKGWAAWKRYLAQRHGCRPIWLDATSAKESPLLWGFDDAWLQPQTLDVLGRAAACTGRPGPGWAAVEAAVAGWLTEAPGGKPHAGYALEALAWAGALPWLAADLSPGLWWDLIDHLNATVEEAQATPLDDQPLVHQLMAGELGLVLAQSLPEISACRRLLPLSRKALSNGLLDLLDGEGLPHAEHLDLFRPLLACWTRCRALAHRLAKDCWRQKAQYQYEWAIRAAIQLARPDGSRVFAPGTGSDHFEELLATAIRFGGDVDDRAIARLALPGLRVAGGEKTAPAALPPAANHSEWAAVSVLRTGWSRSQPRIVVAYPRLEVRLELVLQKQVVFSGGWHPQVRRDGALLEPVDAWQEVCWVSDDDIDYLELEIELDEGVRLQRHVALARQDRFLLLADAILGDRPGRIDYRGRLPLGPEVRFQPAEETTEATLAGKKPLTNVLPLALSEWPGGDRRGTLAVADGALELSQTSRGRSLFAPLLLDLEPRRLGRPLTWRRLTVAESLQIQPHDVAVGYRVMLGKQQWLIYRSLAPAANRTLLGHNLATEMLLARFDRKGEVEPLVEIESG